MAFEMMYTISTALPVCLAALGTGIGQGLIGRKSLEAANVQPHATAEISRISLLGISLTETSAILGLVISIVLFRDASVPAEILYASYGRFGICLAIGITSFVAGIAASFPAQAACLAVARQPFFTNKILQLMLITQSVIMTPNIFGFLIALLIQAKVGTVTNFAGGLQLISAGLAIALGSIGPCIGLSMFASAACTAAGVNRKAYAKILPFSFICEGIIETPAILSLLTALIILNINVMNTSPDLQGIVLLAAALCIGLSTLGTGINTGKVAAAASVHIGENPDNYSAISKVGLLALAMIDTFAIYGFIIALVLISANFN